MYSDLTNDEVLDYCSQVPLALALERLTELRILRSLKFARPILDLGSGDGIFARQLFTHNEIELAVDPSSSETEFAAVYGHNYKLMCRSMGGNLPFRSDSVTTVFSNSVLEHIPDLDAVLRDVHRVLIPNGQFVATVPTDQFERYSLISLGLAFLRLRRLEIQYRRFYNSFWRHYHAYSVPEWEARFRVNGFEIVSSITYGTRLSTALNDLLAPFGIISKLRRVMNSPWVVSTPFRRRYLSPFSPLLRRAVNRPVSGDALVCLVLRAIA
jgi:SAM-dependent methyltransferase